MHEWVHTFLSSRQRRGEYVFCTDRGELLRGETVSKRFKKYVRRAGIDPRIHFHSLRHTGISWLMNHGVQPQFVQRIAGHSSLGVTQIYTHLEDGALLVAVHAFTSPALS